MVNAVYHRGYDVREPVEIRIMHDELVVLSYPGPDRSVRLEQLRVGKAMPRRYRNRRIGEFLKELEGVVTRLEGGDLPLEEALLAFEKGVSLTREGERILASAEERERLRGEVESLRSALGRRRRSARRR